MLSNTFWVWPEVGTGILLAAPPIGEKLPLHFERGSSISSEACMKCDTMAAVNTENKGKIWSYNSKGSYDVTTCYSNLGSPLLIRQASWQLMGLIVIVCLCVCVCVNPTLQCIDMADIFQHLSHSHLLLPLWVEFPVHHHGCFPHCQLKLALRRQPANISLILWSDS